MSNPEMTEYQPPNSWADVAPIGDIRERDILRRADLRKYVEWPVLKAAEIFYDKNIQTVDSTANSNNVRTGHAGLVINYDTLSEENQRIAESLEIGSLDDGEDYRALTLNVPITAETTPTDVSDQMEAAANQFVWQPLTWMPVRTLQGIRKFYGMEESNETFGPEDFTREYYDPAEQLFYMNEEQYRRAKHLPLS